MAFMKRVIGNWKMHKTVPETKKFLEEVLQTLPPKEVYLAVPFTAIAAAASFGIHVGSQNIAAAAEGPFTGEIAARMVKDVGAAFSLIGHSERRHVFGEKEGDVRCKILQAIEQTLTPVLCVGEKLGEDFKEVLKRQLSSALENIEVGKLSALMIAYEPVWAIGTGKSASPDDAAKAHAFCREILTDLFDSNFAAHVPLLYGGSVSVDNLPSLLACSQVNGVLVGGASLVPATFVKLAQIARAVVS